MIRPYQPAQLPTMPTQPAPSIADQFMNMMQPIMQMRQLEMQRQQAQQNLAIGDQRLQMGDMDIQQTQRIMDRDAQEASKKEALAQATTQMLQQTKAEGRIPTHMDVLDVLTSVGVSNPDEVVVITDMVKKHAEQSLKVAAQFTTPESLDQASLALGMAYGIQMSPAELKQSLMSQDDFRVNTSDGRIMVIGKNADGSLSVKENLDTQTPQQRDISNKMEQLKLEEAKLAVETARIKLNQIKQTLSGLAEGKVITAKDAESVMKNVEDASRNYRSLVAEDITAAVLATPNYQKEVELAYEERKNMLNTARIAIESADISDQMKAHYLTRINTLEKELGVSGNVFEKLGATKPPTAPNPATNPARERPRAQGVVQTVSNLFRSGGPGLPQDSTLISPENRLAPPIPTTNDPALRRAIQDYLTGRR